MKIKSLFLAAVFATGVVSTPAMSAAILTNQWYTFGFDGMESSFRSGARASLGYNPDALQAPDVDWTFSLVGRGFITVLDGFDSGDRFAITDFGRDLGETSIATTGSSCGGDITFCLDTPEMSRGIFNLAAGSHAINGTAIASPFGGGAAFFRVIDLAAAVPEPASWALMIGGFGLAAGGLRRRQTVRTTVAYA